MAAALPGAPIGVVGGLGAPVVPRRSFGQIMDNAHDSRIHLQTNLALCSQPGFEGIFPIPFITSIRAVADFSLLKEKMVGLIFQVANTKIPARAGQPAIVGDALVDPPILPVAAVAAVPEQRVDAVANPFIAKICDPYGIQRISSECMVGLSLLFFSIMAIDLENSQLKCKLLCIDVPVRGGEAYESVNPEYLQIGMEFVLDTTDIDMVFLLKPEAQQLMGFPPVDLDRDSSEYLDQQRQLAKPDNKRMEVLEDGENIMKVDNQWRETEDNRLWWSRLSAGAQYKFAFRPGMSSVDTPAVIHDKFEELALRTATAPFATDVICAGLQDLSTIPAIKDPALFTKLSQGKWIVRALLKREPGSLTPTDLLPMSMHWNSDNSSNNWDQAVAIINSLLHFLQCYLNVAIWEDSTEVRGLLDSFRSEERLLRLPADLVVFYLFYNLNKVFKIIGSRSPEARALFHRSNVPILSRHGVAASQVILSLKTTLSGNYLSSKLDS